MLGAVSGIGIRGRARGGGGSDPPRPWAPPSTWRSEGRESLVLGPIGRDAASRDPFTARSTGERPTSGPETVRQGLVASPSRGAPATCPAPLALRAARRLVASWPSPTSGDAAWSPASPCRPGRHPQVRINTTSRLAPTGLRSRLQLTPGCRDQYKVNTGRPITPTCSLLPSLQALSRSICDTFALCLLASQSQPLHV